MDFYILFSFWAAIYIFGRRILLQAARVLVWTGACVCEWVSVHAGTSVCPRLNFSFAAENHLIFLGSQLSACSAVGPRGCSDSPFLMTASIACFILPSTACSEWITATGVLAVNGMNSVTQLLSAQTAWWFHFSFWQDCVTCLMWWPRADPQHTSSLVF